MAEDMTLKFLYDIQEQCENRSVVDAVTVILRAVDGMDSGYMDYNDRIEFIENEYKELLQDTINELDTL